MTTNESLQTRRNRALPRGLATALPVFAARAENAELWDVEGRRYVDFAAGIAVLNVGHRHPAVIKAAREQLEAFTHTAFQVVGYESYVALAERLNALAPIEGEAKSVFFTTGAEAVENAVKIARVATGRSAVIAFGGAFHGRTLLTMALTGKTAPYKQGFGPMPPEVFHVPFPAEYRGVSAADSLAALEELFHNDVTVDRVAAIIIEPVQGEGGFTPAPDDFLRELRESRGIRVIGFVDDDTRLRNRRIQGVPVVATLEQIGWALGRYAPDEVYVTIPSAPSGLLEGIVEACSRADVSCRFVRRQIDLAPGAVLNPAAE